jgi:hypothetical protein
MKYLTTFVLLCLFITPSAKAQTTDADVAVLKAQIEGFIAAQQKGARQNNSTLHTHSGISVEKANGYYAFTLPHVSFIDAAGIRSEIGMLAINAAKADADNWKISMALPTPINSFNKAGKQIIRTDFGTQNLTGIWNTRLGHFTLVKGSIGSIRVSDLVKNNYINIESINLSSSLKPTNGDEWTGTGQLIISTIAAYDDALKYTATLPKIAISSNLSATASKKPLTRDEVAERQKNGQPNGYHILASLIGAPQTATAIVTGLDSVNTQLQRTMMSVKPEQRPALLTNILAVSAVSGIGRPVLNDASSKSYDLVFGSNGTVTINGTDFGSLLTKK